MGKHLILLLGLCASCLLGEACGGASGVAERNVGVPGVTVALGGLRVTNEALELRCEVRNDSQHDIWIYSSRLNGSHIWDRPNANLFMDTDGETLVV
ncbi:MAG: hypothetical protein ACYTAS_20440, partial [Planctomycetota bacterium]